jgi:hypothetical protein
MVDWGASGDVDLYGHLVSVLMGPMAEGCPPPSWPPRPNIQNCDDGDDEHVALRLVLHLNLTEADYRAAQALAAHWLDDPLVKSAIAKVAHALGQAGSLTDAEVRAVLGPGLLGWLEMTSPPQAGALCNT